MLFLFYPSSGYEQKDKGSEKQVTGRKMKTSDWWDYYLYPSPWSSVIFVPQKAWEDSWLSVRLRLAWSTE